MFECLGGNVPLRLLIFDRNKLLLLLRGALDRGGCGGGGGGDDDGGGVGIGRGGHCSRSAAELAGAPSGGPIPHPHLENRVSYADVAVGCLGAAVGGSRWWQPLVAAVGGSQLQERVMAQLAAPNPRLERQESMLLARIQLRYGADTAPPGGTALCWRCSQMCK
jgi:hypothetical protein